MEEQLITFKTAKLAKEKGFDIEESCVAFYTKPRSKMFGIDEHGRYYNIKNTPRKLYYIGKSAAFNSNNVILAPTQSLLQKWLREVHNIRLEIQSLIDYTYAYSIYQELQDNKYCKQIAFEYTEQYSYENALEIGLKHALKLI